MLDNAESIAELPAIREPGMTVASSTESPEQISDLFPGLMFGSELSHVTDAEVAKCFDGSIMLGMMLQRRFASGCGAETPL